jgi:hypothetical protein
MVSPKPLSVFVPDVTLIAFPIPVAIPRGGRAFSSRESLFVSRQEMVLIQILRANSGANPQNPPWLDVSCGVLDGCSQPRNQRRRKNLLIL